MQLLIVLGIVLGQPATAAEGAGLLDQPIAVGEAGRLAQTELIPLTTAAIDAEEDVVHAGHIDDAETGRGGTFRQKLGIGGGVVRRGVVAEVGEDEVGGIEDAHGDLLEVGEAGVAVDALGNVGGLLSISICRLSAASWFAVLGRF